MTAAPGQVFKSINWDQYFQQLNLRPEMTTTSILRLSRLYIEEKGSPQVWSDPELAQAYLSYFLPLNLLRVLQVLAWADETGFFKGLDGVLEHGSGPGTCQLAFFLAEKKFHWQIREPSQKAQMIHTKICEIFGMEKWTSHPSTPHSRNIFVSSYILSETDLPPSAMENEALFLVEASTQKVFRKLLKYRDLLIQNGFSIWAPCTHQQSCPLSPNPSDWCHFHIPFDRPQWFKDIESRLPMKNQTLSLSYLLARRSPPPHRPNYGRVLGQTLYEKGKIRQAFCRSEDREFLSWLRRDGEPPQIPSGTLMPLPKDIIIKGNEIRLKKG